MPIDDFYLFDPNYTPYEFDFQNWNLSAKDDTTLGLTTFNKTIDTQEVYRGISVLGGPCTISTTNNIGGVPSLIAQSLSCQYMTSLTVNSQLIAVQSVRMTRCNITVNGVIADTFSVNSTASINSLSYIKELIGIGSSNTIRITDDIYVQSVTVAGTLQLNGSLYIHDYQNFEVNGQTTNYGKIYTNYMQVSSTTAIPANIVGKVYVGMLDIMEDGVVLPEGLNVRYLRPNGHSYDSSNAVVEHVYMGRFPVDS